MAEGGGFPSRFFTQFNIEISFLRYCLTERFFLCSRMLLIRMLIKEASTTRVANFVSSREVEILGRWWGLGMAETKNSLK